MKAKPLFAVLILLSPVPLYCHRAEWIHTRERISSGQNNSINTFSFQYRRQKNKVVAELERSKRYDLTDTLFFLGGYHDFRRAYVHLGGSRGFHPRLAPEWIAQTEGGFYVLKPLGLIGGYRRRHYAGRDLNIYMPGIDYYFGFPVWIVARYLSVHSTDQTHSFAYYGKLYWQIAEPVRVYAGHAYGDESYRDESTLRIGGYKAHTYLAGGEWMLRRPWGFKADYSHENRNTGIHSSVISAGLFAEW